MKKALRQKTRAFLVALIGATIPLIATVAHAGFQWVPPVAKTTSAPEAAPVVPVAPVVVAPATPAPEAVEKAVLPMPGEQPAPQMNAADAALSAPAKAGLPEPKTLALPPSYNPQPVPLERQPLRMPPDYNPQATTQQNPDNVLKVRTITPQQQAPTPLLPDDTTLPMPEEVSAAPEPVMQESASSSEAPAPILNVPPMPVATTTKVIMPQDAPQNAMDTTPNSQRLVINPFPNELSAAPQSSQSLNMPLSDFATIEGFGSDMPLAIALQQIVPSDYAYAFSPGVNPGASVSWDGGKPWDQVLNDTLSSQGLKAVIMGKVVHIRPAADTQKQSALEPLQMQDNMRRTNIKDPGEQPQIQSANTLAGIESAAGGPETIIPLQSEPTVDEISKQEIVISPTHWEAKAGESLKDILTRWGRASGTELIWMASYDYQIKEDFSTDGDFAGAVDALVNKDTVAENTPMLQIVKNTDGKIPASITIKDKPV